MPQPIVTVYEMYGSGAELVGPPVAEALGVPWEPQAFASETIEAAVIARDQDPDDSLLSRIFRTLGGGPGVLDDRGFRALFAATDYELVQENSRYVLDVTRNGGVILGRNGAVILGDRPGALHVLLTGRVEDRVARAAETAGISRERAARRLESEDSIRAEISQRLYHWDPRDPARYDLVISTSRLDIPAAVEIIVTAVRHRWNARAA
jgi:cytidylate kinase